MKTIIKNSNYIAKFTNHSLLGFPIYGQIILLLFAIVFITSCKKENDNNNETTNTLGVETLSAKWVVNEPSDYESFEFNKSGSYIVIENNYNKSVENKTTHFGSYTIMDDKTIVLSDFGTMKTSQFSDNSMNFTLKLDSDLSNNIEISATKQPKSSYSAKTELLCKTWELFEINGELAEQNELIYMFSLSGIYFVKFDVEDDDSYLGQWKWQDSTEKEIIFYIYDDSTWNEDFIGVVSELTSNKLILFEFNDVLVFKPASKY